MPIQGKVAGHLLPVPARPEIAEPLVDAFVEMLKARGVPTETGIFGAHMEVALVNDGPVTIILEY